MKFISKTINVGKCKTPEDVDAILKPLLDKGFDVKGYMNDRNFIIMTKQTAN